jgi:hypothetical protein
MSRSIKTKIETAKKGESIVATHACRKTYFGKNRVGAMVSITASAIYVKGFVQDLIAGKSLNREKIWKILDEDPDDSGLYPLNEEPEKEAKYQDSISFINKPSDLFYLKITNGLDKVWVIGWKWSMVLSIESYSQQIY